MRSGTAGFVFVVCVLGLMGVAVADLALVSSLQRTGHDYGSFESNEERAVRAKSVVMRPGDRLLVMPNLMGPPDTFGSYDFFVVNGGDRAALLAGEAPREVYFERVGMSLMGCCPEGWITWDRPDDEHASREGSTVEGLTGAIDQPDRLDLVWVLHYGPNAQRPTEPDAVRAWEAAMDRAFSHGIAFHPQFDPGVPTVFEARLTTLHPALTSVMAALGFAATGAASWWAVPFVRARSRPAASGTEGLLEVLDMAGQHLAALRDLFVGSFVVVLGVALHVALVGEPEVMYFLMEFAGIGSAAWSVFALALMLLYASVVVVWAYAGWSSWRALRRWRARQAALPAGFEGEA